MTEEQLELAINRLGTIDLSNLIQEFKNRVPEKYHQILNDLFDEMYEADSEIYGLIQMLYNIKFDKIIKRMERKENIK